MCGSGLGPAARADRLAVHGPDGARAQRLRIRDRNRLCRADGHAVPVHVQVPEGPQEVLVRVGAPVGKTVISQTPPLHPC